MKPLSGAAFAGGALVVVASAIVGGLFVIGSPDDERARRVDERRVSDLRGIAAATNLYWTRHDTLPASLGALGAEPGVRISTTDPANGEAYGYQRLDSVRYEVCGTFERESDEMSLEPELDLWLHGPGLQCFRLEAVRIDEAQR